MINRFRGFLTGSLIAVMAIAAGLAAVPPAAEAALGTYKTVNLLAAGTIKTASFTGPTVSTRYDSFAAGSLAFNSFAGPAGVTVVVAAASGTLDPFLEGQQAVGDAWATISVPTAWTQITATSTTWKQYRQYLAPLPDNIRISGAIAGAGASFSIGVKARLSGF